MRVSGEWCRHRAASSEGRRGSTYCLTASTFQASSISRVRSPQEGFVFEQKIHSRSLSSIHMLYNLPSYKLPTHLSLPASWGWADARAQFRNPDRAYFTVLATLMFQLARRYGRRKEAVPTLLVECARCIHVTSRLKYYYCAIMCLRRFYGLYQMCVHGGALSLNIRRVTAGQRSPCGPLRVMSSKCRASRTGSPSESSQGAVLRVGRVAAAAAGRSARRLRLGWQCE